MKDQHCHTDQASHPLDQAVKYRKGWKVSLRLVRLDQVR